MADDLLNLEDVLRRKNEYFTGKYDACVRAAPTVRRLNVIMAPLINGFAPVRTALTPAVFRTVNNGKDYGKPTIEQRDYACKLLDGSWSVDAAALMADPTGAASSLDLVIESALMGMMCGAEDAIYNGDSESADGSFDGLLKLAAKLGRVVGTGQHTAVLMNRADVKQIWTEESFEPGDIVEQQAVGANAKKMQIKHQRLLAWMSILVGSEQGLLVVKADQLSDNVIASAIADNFYVGYAPDLIATSRKGMESLRQSRIPQSRSERGAPVPTPSDSMGVEIFATDFIDKATAPAPEPEPEPEPEP